MLLKKREIYYNAQSGSYLTLKETEISTDYIEKCNKYAEDLLNASNSTIVFDLIKKTKELKESKVDYIEENKTKEIIK